MNIIIIQVIIIIKEGVTILQKCVLVNRGDYVNHGG